MHPGRIIRIVARHPLEWLGFMYFVCLSLAALLVATSLGTGDRLVWRIASRNLSTRSTATAELESNWARLARPKYYKRFRGKG